MGSPRSVKSFVSQNLILSKFDMEVFSAVALQYSVQLLGLEILLQSRKAMGNNYCLSIFDLKLQLIL